MKSKVVSLLLIINSLVFSIVLAAGPTTVYPANGAINLAADTLIVASPSTTISVYSPWRGHLSGTHTVNTFQPATPLWPGEPILAISSGYAWQFSAATAPGDGVFNQNKPINPAAVPTTDIALADINGDGSLDTCLSHNDFPTLQNLCYLNGGGSKPFGSGVDTTQSIAFLDLDRDGDPDIAVGNSSGASAVYLNDGNGNFNAGQRNFGTPGDPMPDLVAADLNNDAWLDLASPNKIYLSTAGGTFTSGTPIGNPAWSSASIDAGDIDNDGDLDLAIGNRSTSARNIIYLNDGNGSFNSALAFGEPADESRRVCLFDADQDGDLDIAVGNFASQNRVYLNSNFNTAIPFGTGTDHTASLTVADFNGDGYPDIAVGNRAQQNRVYFYDPVLGYTNDTNFGPADTLTLDLAGGDLDGDGDLDLALANTSQQSTAYLNDDFDTYSPLISKSGLTVAPYTTGSVVSWTLTAQHNGPSADLYVNDVLAPNFSYLSHQAAPPLTLISADPAFRGRWENIALGQRVTLTLVTELSALLALTPTNSASFTTTDHLTPTATFLVTPTCSGQPCRYYRLGIPPSISKRGQSTTPYLPGSVVTWTIALTNQGAADNFILSDTLGPDFSYLSHQAAPPLTLTSTGPTFRGNWDNLGANKTALLTLTTRLLTSTTGLTPTNTVSVSSSAYLTPTATLPTIPTCNEQPCPFNQPGAILSPAEQQGSGVPGQNLTYALTLTNTGTLPGSFSLSRNGIGNLSPVNLTVTGYDSQPLTLTLTIPNKTISSTQLTAVITASGQTGSQATALVTTLVKLAPGVGTMIEPIVIRPPPLITTATRITITHLLTNTANTTASLFLTASPPAGWAGPLWLPDIEVGPNQVAQISLVYIVPVTATLIPTQSINLTLSGQYYTYPVQDTVIITPDPDGDADGDGVLNRYEDRNGNSDYNDDDTDSDGLPDYLDQDNDGDGVWTQYEYPDFNGDGNPSDALNSDGDGLPDYLDPNDDNDPWPTIDEGADPDGDGNPADAINTDTDQIPNYLDGDNGFTSDSDADGDGIPDSAECPATPCFDSEGDGTPDYLDLDSDGDGLGDQFEWDKDSNGVGDDTDGDGLADYRDPDDDNDQIPTSNEQPDPNGDHNPTDAVDSDGDGIPDYLDPDDGVAGGDSDQDGIVDSIECPTGVPCYDTDGDGIADYLDLDSDNDSLKDRYECSSQPCLDSDRDGLPDYRDFDDDDDGLPTAQEQPDPNDDGNPDDAVDSDGNGIPDYLDPGQILDQDGDGIPDITECPETPCRDSDGDETPDYLDLDSDNDGVLDRYECPALPCLDTDWDGLPNYRDFNDDDDFHLTILEHADPNGDGKPDDARDSDGDGIPDYLDPVYGPNDSLDADGDGILDITECPQAPCRDSDGDSIPDYLDLDSDADALLDQFEWDKDGNGVGDDTDGDGLADYRDSDDDNDQVPTSNEQPDPNGDHNPTDAVDSDGDGIPDYLDPDDGDSNPPPDDRCLSGGPGGGDSDCDGIPDQVECPAQPCRDSDGDGRSDYLDTDSDGDGVLDDYECPYRLCRDTDGDKLPDYRDPNDDGDNLLTRAESGDDDGDSIPAFLDPDDDEANGPTGGDSDGDGILDYYECLNGVPCADSDGDTVPDYMDSTSNPQSGIYVQLAENFYITWQGIVTNNHPAVALPQKVVEPGEILTYTVKVNNTGHISTTFHLTSSFGSSETPEISQTSLPVGQGTELVYTRQMASAKPATMSIEFDFTSGYGSQRLSLSRITEADVYYFPVILKEYEK